MDRESASTDCPLEPARIETVNADEMVIDALVKRSVILLVTNIYASGWRAEALPGSSHERCQVVPADHTLGATLLTLGRHGFLMVYQPSGYTAGWWVSAVSWCGYVALWGWWLHRRSASRVAHRQPMRPINLRLSR